MSWSISLIGKPMNIITALGKHSKELENPSKEEFDSALPHLIGLINQNYGTTVPNLKLQANGHGNLVNNFRSCTVSIESFYVEMV